jgi:hypothetical protein
MDGATYWTVEIPQSWEQELPKSAYTLDLIRKQLAHEKRGDIIRSERSVMFRQEMEICQITKVTHTRIPGIRPEFPSITGNGMVIRC